MSAFQTALVPAALRWQNPALKGRVPALDGVRGFAVLLVVLYHYVYYNQWTGWMHLAMRPVAYFWTGVDLFFVLSGFLIAGILQDSRQAINYFRVFYTRRAYRILPLYALLLVSWGGATLLFQNSTSAAVHILFERPFSPWAYPAFLQNIFMWIHHTDGTRLLRVTWSLAVEEHFYLLLPLLVWLLRGKRRLLATSVCIILLPAITRWYLASHGDNYWGPAYSTICRADALGYGFLVSIFVRSEAPWKWFLANRPLLYSAIGVALAPGLWIWAFLDELNPVKRSVEFTVVGLVFATMLLEVLAGHVQGRRSIFNYPALRWLGSVSFCVYLFHAAINDSYYAFFLNRQLSSTRDWQSSFTAIAALATTLLLAEASRRWFETPLLRRGHRMQYRYGTAEQQPTYSDRRFPAPELSRLHPGSKK